MPRDAWAHAVHGSLGEHSNRCLLNKRDAGRHIDRQTGSHSCAGIRYASTLRPCKRHASDISGSSKVLLCRGCPPPGGSVEAEHHPPHLRGFHHLDAARMPDRSPQPFSARERRAVLAARSTNRTYGNMTARSAATHRATRPMSAAKANTRRSNSECKVNRNRITRLCPNARKLPDASHPCFMPREMPMCAPVRWP